MRSVAQTRQIPIHDAFLNPMLMNGAERDLVVLMTTLLAMLVFAYSSLTITIAALACWTVAIVVLRRLAKVDSQFSRVYFRHLKYQSRYCAGTYAVTLSGAARSHL
jgi:type IV secretory pathway TrbD component